jgi:hypothetical protein
LKTLSACTLALAVVVLYGIWPLEGGDLWMWLTVGRYTWEHSGPPLVDVFPYTGAGECVREAWIRHDPWAHGRPPVARSPGRLAIPDAGPPR